MTHDYYSSNSESNFMLNNIKIFSFLSGLFGYGIISFFVQDELSSRNITVPYRAVVLFLGILNIAWSLGGNGKRNFLVASNIAKSNVILILTTLFLLVYSFRLFYEIVYNGDGLTRQAVEYPITWIFVCLLPGISFLFIDKSLHHKYYNYSLLFLMITGILIINKSFYGGLNVETRFSSESLNPVSLGLIGSQLSTVSLYRLAVSRKDYESSVLAQIVERVILVMGFLGGIYILFISASRSPLISFFVSLILIFLSGPRKSKITLFSLSVASFVLAFSLSIGTSGLAFFSRISLTLEGADFDSSNFVQRPELYLKSVAYIMDNLLIGFGLEIPSIGYPHNLILEAFLSTGLLGGVVFSILYLYSSYQALSHIFDKNSNWGWLGIIHVHYLIIAIFSGNLYGSNSFWYLLFAMIALRGNLRSKSVPSIIENN
jgi:hypothetical protein